MNRISITFIFLLLAFTMKAGEVKFKIKVANPTTTEFSLNFMDNIFTDEERGFIFNLKAGNESNFIIDMSASSMVTFHYGQETFEFYVELNDSPEIYFDANNVIGTIRFGGMGSTNNNFFVKMQRDFPGIRFPRHFSQDLLPSIWDDELVRKAESMSESAFFSYVDEQKRTQLSRMNGARLSTAFNVYLRNRINYRAAGLKLIYLYVNKWSYNATDLRNKPSASGILSGVNKNDSNLIDHPDFVGFISAFVYTQALAGPEDLRGDAYTFYNVINKHFTGKVRDFLLTKLFFNAFRFGHAGVLDDYYPEFRRTCPYSEFKTFLDEYLGASMSFDEEGPAPAFALPDENGNVINLSDFRGKVVYLSFWATWCKPCLKGFEKSRYIREELEKKGVVLINISVDKEIKTWKETMGRVPMPGVNLISQNNEILRIYDISSLPVYHIIDKNGNFTYLPEGARNVLEEFERLVRQ